ncbi:hypothetical protein D3C87_1905300 [compost metagenome]
MNRDFAAVRNPRALRRAVPVCRMLELLEFALVQEQASSRREQFIPLGTIDAKL